MANRLFLLLLVSALFAGCSSQRMSPMLSQKTFYVPQNWEKPIERLDTVASRSSRGETFNPNFSSESTTRSTSIGTKFTPDFNISQDTSAIATTEHEQMVGEASWYGPGFHGKLTANGERYNQNEMTAAHKILPMDTWVKVTNLENNKAVVVRINDRGPYKKDRIIDLTRTAAERLGFREKGTARVALKILKYPEDYDHNEGLNPYKQVVVQIAVFKGEKRAYSFKDSLARKYHRIPFMIDEKKETGFHVVAGPYDQREEATQIAQALKQEGIENFIRSYKK